MSTTLIKQEAMRLGFASCGISKACFLEEEAPRLEKWLADKHHGNMSYMERNFDKRLDPRLLVEGAKSVISVLMPYYPERLQADPQAPVLAKYAYGEDYHEVVKDKLFELWNYINQTVAKAEGRAFVDSAPVLERAWAKRSGLGWIGRNSCLISPQLGSFHFIGELILDLELEPDLHYGKDHCGRCTRCVDACPTSAIGTDRRIDASRCISYLTIELRDQIPEQFRDRMSKRFFGCDICQDVCPWNHRPIPSKIAAFRPKPELLEMSSEDWHGLSEEAYRKIFSKSAVKRVKFEGLKRNLSFLQAKADEES